MDVGSVDDLWKEVSRGSPVVMGASGEIWIWRWDEDAERISASVMS